MQTHQFDLPHNLDEIRIEMLYDKKHNKIFDILFYIKTAVLETEDGVHKWRNSWSTFAPLP